MTPSAFERALDHINHRQFYITENEKIQIVKIFMLAFLSDADVRQHVSEAIYLTDPKSDGVARYSKGKKVSPDLPYEKLADYEKEELSVKAQAACNALQRMMESKDA